MADAKKSFYAVAVGRKPGIYTSWFGPGGAQAQVKGFNGALYKGFPAREQAEEWMNNPVRTHPARHAGDGVNGQTAADPAQFDILIYTDGGSWGNPGPGGFGIVVIRNGERRELSGGFRRTTNNRMELLGAITALRMLERPMRVLLRTDSQYLVNGMEKGWARKWRSNEWKRESQKPVENCDLWHELLELADRHTIRFEWVRGHAGDRNNERCDQLVQEATALEDLPPDENYEQRRTMLPCRDA